MGVFVCDECEVVENTSLGHFWSRKKTFFLDESKNQKALCSACTPPIYQDGSPTGKGTWHNKFPQLIWDGKRKVMNR